MGQAAERAERREYAVGKISRGLGQWNAYAEAGETHEERKARLEEVPEDMRARVLDHLRTVWALKKIANRLRDTAND